MGKTKPVQINSHFAWIPDNPINIVFAHMCDAGSYFPSITERTLLKWADQASTGNSIAFDYPEEDDVDPETLATVLAEVRQRATAMGDVSFEMLKRWYLPGTRQVCGGVRGWRWRVVPVGRILDVVSWMEQALADELEPHHVYIDGPYGPAESRPPLDEMQRDNRER